MNEPDAINRPSHYANSEIECIDAMVAAFGLDAVRTYCKIAAFKYIWRCNIKHETDDTDLGKAVWYLRFARGDDPRRDNNDNP